jgi:hypothetical protein
VRGPLLKVSRTIEEVLNKLTIWDMTDAEPELAPELVTLGWQSGKVEKV